MNNLLDLSPEVKTALDSDEPLLALETTLIAHGLPFPDNLELALEIAEITRSSSVVPAFTALMEGRIKVGLDNREIRSLSQDDSVVKVSRRDFGRILLNRQTGATTVSGTMIAAHLAGIKVFATGGIGGVHREASRNFDISADLMEFTRSPVIVVSSGAKSILDLPATLEYLETLGVPVLGYQTDNFPAFYSRESGLKIPRINDPGEIIELYNINLAAGIGTGILVANPIPLEHEIAAEDVAKHLEKAVDSAREREIRGNELTPYLLAEIVRSSGGKALQANKDLIRHNVRTACEICKEFRK